MKIRLCFIRPIRISWDWIFLILIEIASTKGPPQISSKSQTRHLIRSGEILRLTCPVESVPPPLVTWQKDGETIHLGWDRYRINEDSHLLKVKDLELADSGVFVCRATNGFGSVQVKYLVYVYDANATVLPPDDFDEDVFETLPGREDSPQFLNMNQMESSVNHQTGDTIHLSCKASGIPKPDVTWYRVLQGQTAKVNDDEADDRWTLRIVNARVTDSGKYLCKVTNKAGSVNFTFSVHVAEKETSSDDEVGSISRPPRNTSALVGSKATFECQIESTTVPHVQWLKRLETPEEFHRRKINSSTTVLLDGHRYAVLHAGIMSNPADGTFVNRLTIVPLAYHDTGMYVCSTTTSEGFSYKTAFLSVMPSGSSGAIQEVSTGSMLDAAFLPVIIGIVVVVAVVFFAVVVFVVCRRSVCGTKSNRLSADAPSMENPAQRLTTTPSVFQGGGGVVVNTHPYQQSEARFFEHQYAVRSNPQGGHVAHAGPLNPMGVPMARCHPPDTYTHYSSIAKTTGIQTPVNNKQLLLQQQQQQQHYQQQQQQQTTPQSLSQLTQLHYYENC